MQIALAVPTIAPDWRHNVATMERMAQEAARNDAAVVLFSEAAVTGFCNTGDHAFDLALGQPIDGAAITRLRRAASVAGVWIGVGLFERDGAQLYDSYAMLSPRGTLAATYRRIDPHWHHWFAQPAQHPMYAQGEHVVPLALPIGRSACLLCGDLFNDGALAQVERLRPDWLIVPMARGFDSEVATAAEWYAHERFVYVERARQANVPLLLVNQLASLSPAARYFGGAMAATRDGSILAELPLGQAGILYVDVAEPEANYVICQR